jgi:Holliday junction DNA helicase RuvA
MFDFIKGCLIEKSAKKVVIEVNDIGYRLHVPFNDVANLPELECEVMLYTTCYQKENELLLYGFLQQQVRTFFETLIQISGVGPKVALNLIGHFQFESLLFALQQNDTKTLTKIPGIGKKTIERILLELRGKLSEFSNVDAGSMLLFNDAIKALVHLGYPESRAQRAVQKLLEDHQETDLGNLVTKALKLL